MGREESSGKRNCFGLLRKSNPQGISSHLLEMIRILAWCCFGWNNEKVKNNGWIRAMLLKGTHYLLRR